jgi:hypothetical protein
MFRSTIRNCFNDVSIVGGLLLISLCSTSSVADQRRPSIRNFEDVKAIVGAHFKSVPEFKQGDLITRSATQQLFQRLKQFGWQVQDEKDIIELTLEDGDFLVKTFKSSKGREFLKTISGYPEGLDRVDRLARMPQGQSNVHDLVYKIPNGTDWIKSMTSQANGRDLSNRLAQTQNGKDFNKPTGRLYSVEDLVKRLQTSFEQMQTKTVRNRTR